MPSHVSEDLSHQSAQRLGKEHGGNREGNTAPLFQKFAARYTSGP